jgi:hypothetical protein
VSRQVIFIQGERTKQAKKQPALLEFLSAEFMGNHTGYPTIQALFDALAGSFYDGRTFIKQWELYFLSA